MESIFFELSAIIIVSTALALIAKLMRQPIILAFMLAGIILGPLGLNWLHSHELIDVLAEFGIAFLLYLIGIELDISKFKDLNKVAIVAGFGQVMFTGFAGFVASIVIGFPMVQAWLIAVALTFSSTIIIVKTLSEKRQLESLYGRITIAILIIQDFLAAFALLILDSFGEAGFSSGIPWGVIGLTLVKGVFVGLLAWVLAKFVFKRIFVFIGHSQELLFLWSIAWCLLFAALSLALNFSLAIGVFFAGIALASLEYNYEIAARIRTLRDFFIVIFFAFLGSQLVLSMNATLLLSSLLLSVFVLVGNPMIVYFLLRIMKHSKRTAFFAGLAIGQISEFSFIIANVGLGYGYLTPELVSMIAVIGIITMLVSTYFITYNEQIFKLFEPVLNRLPLGNIEETETDELPEELNDHIVIFGYHLTANSIIEKLGRLGKQIVVVDYNPNNTEHIKKLKGVYYIYGDMRDVDILERAALNEANLIISLVPYPEPTMSLVQYVSHFELKGALIVSARHLSDVDRFYKAGATFVLHPESISLDYLRRVIEKEELNTISEQHKKEIITLLKEFHTYV